MKAYDGGMKRPRMSGGQRTRGGAAKEDAMIKTLWRLSREAIRYRTLYVVAILSTLALTGVNLAAPRALSAA